MYSFTAPKDRNRGVRIDFVDSTFSKEEIQKYFERFGGIESLDMSSDGKEATVIFHYFISVEDASRRKSHSIEGKRLNVTALDLELARYLLTTTSSWTVNGQSLFFSFSVCGQRMNPHPRWMTKTNLKKKIRFV